MFCIRQTSLAASSASILLLSAVQLSAADQPVIVTDPMAAATQSPPLGLWRLPLGPGDLTLEGEYDRREMAVYLSPAQASGSARLILSLQSAVSVMPEASELTVFVNNVKVGETRLGSEPKTIVEANLQPGLLQPGLNAVSVVARQTHRVDCSKEGTYELWSWIDPAESGLVFAGVDNTSYDLAALGAGLRGADGQLNIRGHFPSRARLSLVDNLLQVFQSVVVGARISSFAAQMGATEMNEPGLDIFVGTASELSEAGLDAHGAVEADIPGVRIVPPKDGRAVFIVSGESDEELGENIRNLARAASAMRVSGAEAGIAAFENAAGRMLSGNQTLKLTELGYAPQKFRGRHYRDHVTFRLPADFYAADYDKASLTLDAAYAPGLLPTSTLIVKVNGRTVSTLALSATEGGVIKRQRLPIPLSNLRPGENLVSIEADLPSQSDLACDVAALANGGPRLMISPDSTLTLPRLARVGHAPDLAATMAGLSNLKPTAEKAINLFVPGLRQPSLDAAATLLGRMAYSSGHVYTTRLSSVAPNDGIGDMIAVGTYSEIPSELLGYVGIESAGSLMNMSGSVQQPDANGPGGWLAAQAATTMDWMNLSQMGGDDGEPSRHGAETLRVFSEPLDPVGRLAELAGSVKAYVANLYGRITGTAAGNAVTDIPRVAPGENTGMILAQRISPRQADATWTVVASPDDAALANSMRRLAQRPNWVNLQGAISSLPKEGAGVATVAASQEQLFETSPRSFSNLRLVLAGWLSHNLESYVAGLFSTFILLGIATHMLSRRVGRRNR
jgi:hypothetical protein